MQYDMSQAELIEAVQFYLNEKVLKRPIVVTKVEPQEKRSLGMNYTLHVTVTDDGTQTPAEFHEAARSAA